MTRRLMLAVFATVSVVPLQVLAHPTDIKPGEFAERTDGVRHLALHAEGKDG
jgi:hypothetical protein